MLRWPPFILADCLNRAAPLCGLLHTSVDCAEGLYTCRTAVSIKTALPSQQHVWGLKEAALCVSSLWQGVSLSADPVAAATAAIWLFLSQLVQSF